jgi:hypothetical protein
MFDRPAPSSNDAIDPSRSPTGDRALAHWDAIDCNRKHAGLCRRAVDSGDEGEGRAQLIDSRRTGDGDLHSSHGRDGGCLKCLDSDAIGRDEDASRQDESREAGEGNGAKETVLRRPLHG